MTVIDGRQETASGSAVSPRFELSKSIWNLLFQVEVFYSVVLYLYPHICILCYFVGGLSMYRMFVRCILYFIYFPETLGGKGSVKITLFWIKKLLEAYILTLLVLCLFVTLSLKHQITQVLCTNAKYYRRNDVRKAWRININCYRYLIQMYTFWSAPKQGTMKPFPTWTHGGAE